MQRGRAHDCAHGDRNVIRKNTVKIKTALEISLTEYKSRKRRCPRPIRPLGLANKTVHALSEGLQEPVDLALGSLDLEVNATVRQVLDEPADLKFLGDLAGSESKSNALNMPVKKHLAVMDRAHGISGNLLKLGSSRAHRLLDPQPWPFADAEARDSYHPLIDCRQLARKMRFAFPPPRRLLRPKN